MSIMYFILVPVFLFSVHNRVKELVSSVKQKNSGGVKMNALFLVLIFVVATLLVLLIERSD